MGQLVVRSTPAKRIDTLAPGGSAQQEDPYISADYQTGNPPRERNFSRISVHNKGEKAGRVLWERGHKRHCGAGRQQTANLQSKR